MDHSNVRSIVISAMFGILVSSFSASASATTPSPGTDQKRICLFGDISAYQDGNAGDYLDQENSRLFGARIRVQWFNGTTFSTGWLYADPDDACILIDTDIGATYTVSYRPYSQVLAGPDELYVRQSNSNLPTYSFTVALSAGEQTHLVVAPPKATTRIYAAMAHAIQRFPAVDTHFRLTVWNDWDGTGTTCFDPADENKTVTRSNNCGGDVHVNIASDSVGGAHDERKFVIAHEYGHANLNGLNTPNDTDCDPGTTPSCEGGVGGNHRMRSEEFASGAAMEGWSHFVASDVFSYHGDGTSPFIYQDGGTLDFAGNPGSSCPPAANMPILENDPIIYPNDKRDQFYVTCTPGSTSEPDIGVELDWARFWWMLHDSGTMSGSPLTHTALHYVIVFTNGWSETDIYPRLKAYGGAGTRLTDAAQASGICSGTNC